MIEANWSIDGVSPLHKAQLGNSLRRDCSRHQQLSGKFCLLFEPNFRRARHDVLRPNSVVSPHLIPLQHKIRFVIDDDCHVAARRKKNHEKGCWRDSSPFASSPAPSSSSGPLLLDDARHTELCVTLYLRA